MNSAIVLLLNAPRRRQCLVKLRQSCEQHVTVQRYSSVPMLIAFGSDTLAVGGVSADESPTRIEKFPASACQCLPATS